MNASDLLRYGLWCATALTARANRRHYRMPTTWAPHLALNTAALLLPDALRLLGPKSRGEAPSLDGDLAAIARLGLAALAEVAGANPAYPLYVAPFTLGYLTSHPQFDIYKGPLGERRLAGFGLDAIPHALTALSLTLLAGDLLRAAADAAGGDTRPAELLRWCASNRALATGALLAILTAAWETGEWMALRYELRERGDPALVNMQWSVPDTLRDCASNAAGWALACALRPRWDTPTEALAPSRV
jgi:hypothetical protein